MIGGTGPANLSVNVGEDLTARKSGSGRLLNRPTLDLPEPRQTPRGTREPPSGHGAARGIRTPDPQIRSLMLYPAELWLQRWERQRLGMLLGVDPGLRGAAVAVMGRSGAARRSRTSNRQIRSLVLYPVELWLRGPPREGWILANPGSQPQPCGFARLPGAGRGVRRAPGRARGATRSALRPATRRWRRGGAGSCRRGGRGSRLRCRAASPGPSPPDPSPRRPRCS